MKRGRLSNLLDNNTIASLALLILSLSVLSFVLVGQFFLQPSFISGSSMEPSFHDGQMAFYLRNFDSQNINIGAIIVYDFSKTLSVCHRVVSKGTDNRGIFYIAKGDNNTIADPLPVRPEQIKGILVFAQPIYLLPLELFSPAGSFLFSITVLNRIKSRGGENKK